MIPCLRHSMPLKDYFFGVSRSLRCISHLFPSLHHKPHSKVVFLMQSLYIWALLSDAGCWGWNCRHQHRPAQSRHRGFAFWLLPCSKEIEDLGPVWQGKTNISEDPGAEIISSQITWLLCPFPLHFSFFLFYFFRKMTANSIWLLKNVKILK